MTDSVPESIERSLFPEGAAISPSCFLEPVTTVAVEPSSYALASMEPWVSLGYSATALARYLTRPDPALHRYRVLCESAPAGILCLRHPWMLGPYIELLAIFPSHQGKRSGTNLLGWIEQRCRFASLANLWVTVSESNRPARRFYKRQGFSETAVLADLVRTGHSEILMRKRLG